MSPQSALLTQFEYEILHASIFLFRCNEENYLFQMNHLSAQQISLLTLVKTIRSWQQTSFSIPAKNKLVPEILLAFTPI